MSIHERAKKLEEGPIWKFLDSSIIEAEDGKSVVEMPINDDIKQMYGTVHGGIIGTLIDMAMASAVTSLMSNEENAVTVDLSVHYLNGAKKGTLIGKGRVIKKGRRMAFLEADVWNDNQLVAKGTASFMVLQKN